MIHTQKTINDYDVKYFMASKEMYIKSSKRLGLPENFIYKKKLSTDETGIWINDSLKQIIIAFRGDINYIHDVFLKTFLKCKSLSDSWRFKTTFNHVREIKKTHPNYTLSYTGFNLGGDIALELLWKYIKDKCVIFDVENKSKHRYKGLNVSWYVCNKSLLETVENDSYKKMIFIELDNSKNKENHSQQLTLLNMYRT